MSKKIFKIIGLNFMFFSALLVCNSVGAREDKEKDEKEGKQKFLVTAYYSPLPDQTFYIRGSYELDKELNGEGIAGADGTEVYEGMLAAPGVYPFGTKIKIPGLGVGEVHDRGGAIQENEDYDRIDVWMGHGEEGLSRALNWGSRFVEGEVYEDSESGGAGFDYSWLDSNLSDGMVAQLKTYSNSSSKKKIEFEEDDEEENEEEMKPSALKKANILPPLRSAKSKNTLDLKADPEIAYLERKKNALPSDLGLGSEGEEVKQLQQMLQEVGYFQADLTGVYDQTTVDSIVELQKDTGLIESKEDEWAGYFGPRTQRALQDTIENRVEVLETYPQEAEVEILPKEELPALDRLTLFQAPEPRNGLSFELAPQEAPELEAENDFQTLALNDQGEKVKDFQEKLVEKGYLSADLVTGYFDEETVEAVIEFQLDNGIVTDESDPVVGRVDLATFKALME